MPRSVDPTLPSEASEASEASGSSAGPSLRDPWPGRPPRSVDSSRPAWPDPSRSCARERPSPPSPAAGFGPPVVLFVAVFRVLGALARGVTFFLGGVLDLFGPPRCHLCGVETATAPTVLCETCRDEVQPAAPGCARCGAPIPALLALAARVRSPLDAPGADTRRLAPELPECGACTGRPGVADRTLAVFDYEGAARDLILAWKFRGDLGAERWLVRELAVRVPALGPPWPRPIVCGVPRHPLKRWWTGRDPALELARAFARELDWPFAPLLRRVAWRPPQSRLSRAARRRRPRGSFRASPRAGGRRVILIDDVLTTGSTLAECVRVLRAAGATRIEVLTLARTPD